MTDQFQHVMVLTSIIIGLGITYILIGVGSAIERITGHGTALRLSWAHATWLVTLFVWMVSFWWWEFRLLALLRIWTLGHYFFIITYAVLLFLLAVLILPRDWTAIDSLDDYFLSKRRWFYPVYLIAILADIVDAWLKGGWPYIQANGVSAYVYWAAAIPVCVVGVRSKNIRTHSFMAIIICVLQLIAVYEVFPKLGLQPRPGPNDAMQPTARRRTLKFPMAPTCSPAAALALASIHPSSRLPWCDSSRTHSRPIVVPPTMAVADLVSR